MINSSLPGWSYKRWRKAAQSYGWETGIRTLHTLITSGQIRSKSFISLNPWKTLSDQFQRVSINWQQMAARVVDRRGNRARFATSRDSFSSRWSTGLNRPAVQSHQSGKLGSSYRTSDHSSMSGLGSFRESNVARDSFTLASSCKSGILRDRSNLFGFVLQKR